MPRRIRSDHWDCIVVGAGHTGAGAALFLAARGLKTLLIDRRARARAGAAWVNGVAASLFDELDLGTPPDGVVVHHATRFLLQPVATHHRVIVTEPPTLEVDMGALTRWLTDEATRLGVTTRFDSITTIGEWDGETREVVSGGDTLRARVVIDASGLPNPLPRGYIAALDICNAWQGTFDVADRDAALAWMRTHQLREGDVLSLQGVEGGYSILNLSVHDDGRRVAMLTGAMHRPTYRSGVAIARDALAKHPWIGDERSGGGGLIPLRPTTENLVDDGLVTIGNRAGMVFPLHGSGVATGLHAASIAANTIAATIQIGDGRARDLWPINTMWQRELGAICAFYQPLRYVASSFLPRDSALLAEAGILNAEAVRAGLVQALPEPRLEPLLLAPLYLRELAPLLPRLLVAYRLANRMRDHWRAFPRTHDDRDFRRWNRRAERLLQEAQLLALGGRGDGSLLPRKD